MIVTPVLGTEAQFHQVRSYLEQSGYTEPGVCTRSRIESIHLFKSLHDGRMADGAGMTDALDLLISLFMDSEQHPRATVERWIPAEVLATLQALQLIVQPEGDQLYATVLLYPVEELYIISDLTRDHNPAATQPLAVDVVYPAITTSSGRFLSQVSRAPSERFLEMCAGTGIAALVGARTAGHAWSLDITARSTHFARFNAALNGITNFTALQGDLFEPVRGMTFDRIVAHPPYVPSKEQTLIYRDGGEDGEQITRRILSQLPEFLAPGGRYQCTCVATDRTHARLEQRVREMIGPRHEEFDVLLSTALEYEPISYFTRTALDRRMDWSALEPTLRTQQALQVERMVYSHIEVQRRATPRAVFTRRRQLAPITGWRETDWLMSWETRVAEGDDTLAAALIRGRPTVAPGAVIQIEMHQDGGSWIPTECAVGVEWPYPLRVKCPPWAADLLAQSDGSITLAELCERFQAAGVLPPEGPEAAFLAFVRILVGSGILLFDSLPLPPRPRSRETQHPVA